MSVINNLQVMLDEPSSLDHVDTQYVAAAIVELSRLRGALAYYADPQNTVRDCMSGGSCANCDMCKLAIDTLKEFK